MSRQFDGLDDQMVFAVPASGLSVSGAHTILAVVRIIATADNTWLSFVETETSAAAASASIGRSNNGEVYWSQGATFGDINAITDTDGWLIAAGSKTAGSSDPRLHRSIIGGANTHAAAAAGSLVAAPSIASGTIRLGGNDDFANIRLCAAAIFDRVLSDSEIDGINTAKTTQSIFDLTPVWLVDDLDAFATDYMGNADRTSITGTADSADDPSGWVYGVGGAPTESGSASTTVGFTSTASGRRKAVGAATTTTALASAAAGRRKALAHHDEVSAVPPFTIAVPGVLTITGFTSAATGDEASTETHSGAATTTVGLASTATGRRKAQRAATSTTGATSVATARRVSRGAASTTVGFTSAAAGNDQPIETHQGAATSTCGFTSTASGRRRALGAAASSNGITSTAGGRRRSRGACVTTVGFTSTAAGANGTAPVRSGAASTILGLASAATGRRASRGTCTTTVSFTSSALGRNPADGPLIHRTAPAGRISRPGVGTLA